MQNFTTGRKCSELGSVDGLDVQHDYNYDDVQCALGNVQCLMCRATVEVIWPLLCVT